MKSYTRALMCFGGSTVTVVDVTFNHNTRDQSIYTLSPPKKFAIAGDFDRDGDLAGNDFLVWERSPTVGDLTEWQNNYGMALQLSADAAVVP